MLLRAVAKVLAEEGTFATDFCESKSSINERLSWERKT
jgi:hypothetical protein